MAKTNKKGGLFSKNIWFEVGLFIFIIYIIPSSYAVTGQVNTWTTGNGIENLTFTGNQNLSLYVDIPRYGYVTTASISFNLYNNRYNLSEDYTYSNSGNWLPTAAYLYDNDFNTYSYIQPPFIGRLNTNYTNLDDSITYTLRVKYSDAKELSFKINKTCIYGNRADFDFNIDDARHYFSCYNLTDYTKPSYTFFTDIANQGNLTAARFWEQKLYVTGYNNLTVYLNDYQDIAAFNYSLNDTLNVTYINNILADCDNVITNSCRLNITLEASGNLSAGLSNTINYTYGIDACTNSFNIPSNATAFNFNFKDQNEGLQYVNISTNIEYINASFNHQYLNTNNISYCIYPNWLSLYANFTPLEYSYQGNPYSYYSHDALFDNITNNITLYVNNEPTQVIATVYDGFADEVENAYIYVQRYNIDAGTYDLLGIYQTNFEGEAAIYLTLNSVYYRFLIYYPAGTLVLSTTPTYVYTNTISFQINTGDTVLDDYYTIQDMTYSFTFNNDTDSFKLIYSDTSSSISQACVYVYKQTLQEYGIYDSTCSSSTSGTILISVTPLNGTTYTASAYATLNNENYLLDTISHHYPSRTALDIIGNMGLIIAIILTIAFAFIMMWSIPIGVIVVPLPLIILSYLGIIALDPALAISLELAALVIAVFIGRRG
jgi:hypothetical protein